MASSFNTNQITTQSTPTLIATQNIGRKITVVTNLGMTAIYLGPSSGVTTGS